MGYVASAPSARLGSHGPQFWGGLGLPKDQGSATGGSLRPKGPHPLA
jgi:hypothetical protein